MKIHDISQELFSSVVFPGDPAPIGTRVHSMEDGHLFNLTTLSMCAHNGTHVDAPLHFVKDGKSIDQMDLSVFVGECYVARHDGDITAEDALRILDKSQGIPRLLIAGDAVVTLEAARVFATRDLLLVGNESQTVGPPEAPAAVHQLLLGCGFAFLEGVVLKGIPEGRYILHAAPINLGGTEGSPCRAYLVEE